MSSSLPSPPPPPPPPYTHTHTHTNYDQDVKVIVLSFYFFIWLISASSGELSCLATSLVDMRLKSQNIYIPTYDVLWLKT